MEELKMSFPGTINEEGREARFSTILDKGGKLHTPALIRNKLGLNRKKMEVQVWIKVIKEVEK